MAKQVTIPFALYDSFAARRFAGNVAAVVITDQPLPTRLMEQIAAEFAAPTTGFATAFHGTLAEVRFHTPHQEINACGHVTLALAAELDALGIWSVAEGAWAEFVAPTAAGPLPVRLHRGGHGLSVELTFRPRLVAGVDADRSETDRALGVASRVDLPIEIVDTGLHHLVVPLGTPEDLAALVPTRSALLNLGASFGAHTICAFAHVGGGSFRMRDLTAPIGDLEEPASGTTSAALAQYAVRHGLVRECAVISIAQGVEMGRPSNIEVVLEAGDNPLARVSGQAIKTASGHVLLGGPE